MSLGTNRLSYGQYPDGTFGLLVDERPITISESHLVVRHTNEGLFLGEAPPIADVPNQYGWFEWGCLSHVKQQLSDVDYDTSPDMLANIVKELICVLETRGVL